MGDSRARRTGGATARAALYRALFEHAADPVLLTRTDGTLLRANAAACDAFGLTEGELRREGWAGRCVDDDALRAFLAERERTGSARGELKVRRADGTVFTVEVTSAIISEEGGERYSYVVFREVTARRRAEDAVRESEQRFRLLSNAMPQIVCVLGPDGTPDYVNRSWTEFSGLDLEATARAGWESVVHPDDVAAARACRLRVLKQLAPQDVELRYRAADGSYRWFISRLVPMVEDGRVVRLVGAGMEIEAHRRAEEALREADRRKDEFLSMLSHELRNPLAPIRNALYILDRADPASDQARRAKEIAKRQVGHLTRLVEDLLDITRVARGKVELRRTDLDLVALAARAAEDHRAVMQERGIELSLALAGDPLIVSGDETRLAQVLGNLLSNAAKFTPAGGRVTLSARAERGQALLEVRDTGPGIAHDLLASIFDPFTQAKQTLARSEGGLGLGLALVKGIVELHGGSVAARSEGAGLGARFVVTLPLVPARTAASSAGAEGRPSTAPRRVLVVDDDRDAAETLAELVSMLGHEALVAFDGPRAIVIARERAPDVVLCDIGLPGMSGFEVARQLRAAHGRALRLVAVTAYAQPEEVARAEGAGFDAHLAKPMDPATLARVLAG